MQLRQLSAQENIAVTRSLERSSGHQALSDAALVRYLMISDHAGQLGGEHIVSSPYQSGELWVDANYLKKIAGVA